MSFGSKFYDPFLMSFKFLNLKRIFELETQTNFFLSSHGKNIVSPSVSMLSSRGPIILIHKHSIIHIHATTRCSHMTHIFRKNYTIFYT
jgi:hypothetical protein